MRKTVRFEDVLGEWIGESGSESIHTCQVCGKPKLYWNKRAGLWYCFVCGVGGRTTYDDKHTSVCYIPNDEHEQPPAGTALLGDLCEYYHPLCNVDPKKANIMLAKRGIASDEIPEVNLHVRKHNDSYWLVIGLRLNKKWVGAVECNPEVKVGRYTNYRTRGIAWSLIHSTMPEEVCSFPSRRRLILTEGFFDYLSIVQALHLSRGYWEGAASVGYLAGNHASREQMADILRIVGEMDINQVYIAFDNDLLGPPLAIQRLLRLLLPKEVMCVRLLQPNAQYKDWNEYVMAEGQRALDLLSGLQ